MFETIDSAKIHMPSECLPNGKKMWASVNLRFHQQWFQVIYKMETEDNSKDPNVIFITDDEYIAGMMLIENCQVLEVYLISPSYVNGSNSWQMDKVKEVWKAVIPSNEFEKRGRIYILENDNKYVHSFETMNKDEFIKDQLIFRINC